MSGLFGENRDIFFPKLSDKLHLITFAEIAVKYLKNIGYEPYECESEEEARELVKTLPQKGKWPVYFFNSDTTGEKDFEEFYTGDEIIDWDRFASIGVIKNEPIFDNEKLDYFMYRINKMRERGSWSKKELVDLFNFMIPNFNHLEKGKYLDEKM